MKVNKTLKWTRKEAVVAEWNYNTSTYLKELNKTRVILSQDRGLPAETRTRHLPIFSKKL
jgi:hypothetical protein